MSLNPEISKKIIPINATIGLNGLCGAYKLEDLLSLLEKAGFEYMIYRIDPFGWVKQS